MTWYSYEYARAYDGTHADGWDVGHAGEPMTLQERVLASFPGEEIRVQISGTVITIEFEDKELDAGEETTLDGVVTAQKGVSDWPINMADLCCVSLVRENFAKPPAENATTLLAAVSANGNSTPDDQPEYPCNVNCILAGGSDAVDVTVTITGKLANGIDSTEEIAIGTGDATYAGDKAFMLITDIAYTGTWDGGDITFKNGPLIGLSHKNIGEVMKEVFDGADQSIGTLDTDHCTYEPTGTLDGAKALELWLAEDCFCDS